MSPITEIILQILALTIAGGLMKWAYNANKRAKPHNLQSYRVELNAREFNARLDAYGYAIGFFTGLAIIIFLVIKLFKCGVVCGPEWW